MRTPRKAQQATPAKLCPATPSSVRSPYVKAKKVLSSSAGETLVGRDDEYNKIYNMVQEALENQKSLAVYVSGPAGTGKTLTVSTVIQNLESKHHFKLINMNCMSFETLANFYEQVSSHYGSSPKKHRKNSISEQQNELTKIKDAIYQHNEMTVMVLDEVDQLKSKNNQVLRNIFMLPALTNNKLVLIGISNALDFTAKMLWIKELDKSNFCELRFMPYSKEQIVQIIDHRLKSTKNEENTLIDKFALEYCARKIASCSGDIRKALDVCRRAIELVENNSRKAIVRSIDFGSPLKANQNQDNISGDDISSSSHVDLKSMMNALNKVYGGVVDKLDTESKVYLPSDQQLILCTLLLLLKCKSMREVKLSECRQYLSKICSKKGITSEGKSESDILTMCQLLADYGYLSIKNDAITQTSGRTPSKLGRTPTKKKPVVLSLRIDPSETEQLLSTFHKSIITNGAALIC